MNRDDVVDYLCKVTLGQSGRLPRERPASAPARCLP
jgi:hypothetical protein